VRTLGTHKVTAIGKAVRSEGETVQYANLGAKEERMDLNHGDVRFQRTRNQVQPEILSMANDSTARADNPGG